MSWRAVAWAMGSTVVALATLIGVLIATFDINDHKDTLAAAIEAETGRKVTIAGQARLSLSFVPTIGVEDLTLPNASWGSRPEMLRLRRLEAVVELRPLLAGKVRIRRLRLVRPDLLLETSREGRGNWMLGGREDGMPGATESFELPTIQRVSLRDATIAYRDGRTGKTTTVRIARLEARAASLAAPIVVELAASHDGIDAAVKGTVGAITELIAGGKPWPAEISGTVLGAAFRFEGSIKDLTGEMAIAGKLAMSGDDLARIGAPIGIRLPAGQFAVETALRGSAARIELDSLAVKWREHDVAGALRAEPRERPIRITADLAAKTVDADALMVALGSGHARPRHADGSGRVVPDFPFETGWLGLADVEARLSVGRLSGKGIVLNDVSADAWSRGGIAELTRLKGRGFGGAVEASAQLDTTDADPKLWSGLWLSGVDVDEFVREIGGAGAFRGKGEVWAVLQGSGRSLHPVLGALEGYVTVQIGGGVIEHARLPADLAKKLGRWVSGPTTTLQCLIAHHDIEAGIARSKSLLFDSDRVIAIGEGGSRLAQETLEYSFALWPKLGLSVDPEVQVRLRGSYAQPVFDVDTLAAVGSGIGSLFANILLLPVSAILGVLKERGNDAQKCDAAAKLAGELRDARPSAPPPRQGIEDVGEAARRAAEKTGGAATRMLEGVGRGIERGLRDLFGR